MQIGPSRSALRGAPLRSHAKIAPWMAGCIIVMLGCSASSALEDTVMESYQGGWPFRDRSILLLAAEATVKGRSIECLAGVVQTRVDMPDSEEDPYGDELAYTVLVKHSGEWQSPTGRVTRMEYAGDDRESLHQELWFEEGRVEIDYWREHSSGEEEIEVSGREFDLADGRTFLVDLASDSGMPAQVNARLDPPVLRQFSGDSPWDRYKWYAISPVNPRWKGGWPFDPIQELIFMSSFYSLDDEETELVRFLRLAPTREIVRPSHIAGWEERAGSFPLITGEMRFQDGEGGCMYALVGTGDERESHWRHSYLFLVRLGGGKNIPMTREESISSPMADEVRVHQRILWKGHDVTIDYKTGPSPTKESLEVSGRQYDLGLGRLFLLDLSGTLPVIEQMSAGLGEVSAVMNPKNDGESYTLTGMGENWGWVGGSAPHHAAEYLTLIAVANLERNEPLVYAILGSREEVPPPDPK